MRHDHTEYDEDDEENWPVCESCGANSCDCVPCEECGIADWTMPDEDEETGESTIACANCGHREPFEDA